MRPFQIHRGIPDGVASLSKLILNHLKETEAKPCLQTFWQAALSAASFASLV